jgi:hypothetical protein
MSLKAIYDNIGEVISAAIVASAVTFAALAKDWLKKKHKPFSIRISAEKNDRIQEVLLELRLMLKADRAHLNMFHNGNKYIEGSEILKYSRTNESVGPGISFEAQHYQGIMISLVPDLMRLVTTDGPSYTKVDDLQDGKFKRMLISRGVKAVAVCSVNREKSIIGFIGLSYNTLLAEPPANILDLCKYAGIIEQIIAEYETK